MFYDVFVYHCVSLQPNYKLLIVFQVDVGELPCTIYIVIFYICVVFNVNIVHNIEIYIYIYYNLKM